MNERVKGKLKRVFCRQVDEVNLGNTRRVDSLRSLQMNKKILVSTSVVILSCLALLLFNLQSFLLCAFLILLAFVKHKIYPIKKELFWYLLVGFGGAFIEIILVNIGNAWGYSTQHIFNIPIWMIFFWATLGITIISLYEGINIKESK